MIENIRDFVSTKIERTLNNLSNALDSKLSQNDIKLDAINSKNVNFDRNIHHLTKTVDEFKTEHELLEHKKTVSNLKR